MSKVLERMKWDVMGSGNRMITMPSIILISVNTRVVL